MLVPFFVLFFSLLIWKINVFFDFQRAFFSPFFSTLFALRILFFFI